MLKGLILTDSYFKIDSNESFFFNPGNDHYFFHKDCLV